MKIISDFKDYYDYLISIYGVDESIVYVRRMIDKDDIILNSRSFDYPIYDYQSKGIEFKWIVVTGKKYLFVRTLVPVKDLTVDKWYLYDNQIPELVAYLNLPTNLKKARRWHSGGYNREHYVGAPVQAICKEVGHPVFAVRNTYWAKNGSKHEYHVTLEHKIPMLAEYGFNNIIPPEQLYQELEYYLCNILRDSPDIQPPVVIGDKDMIVSKGFDLKQSFRHRK